MWPTPALNGRDSAGETTQREMSRQPQALTVLIRDEPVGTVTVSSQNPWKVFGVFTPDQGFEPYRPIFESEVHLARQFDRTVVNNQCDDLLWNRLMTAYEEITNLGIRFAE